MTDELEFDISMPPYLLEHLKVTPDGAMLDNSLVMYKGHDDLNSFGDSEGTFAWD